MDHSATHLLFHSNSLFLSFVALVPLPCVSRFSNATHGRSSPRDDFVAQTPLIPSDSLIIEVYVTSGQHEQVEVIASSVVHSFRNVFQLISESQKVGSQQGGGKRRSKRPRSSVSPRREPQPRGCFRRETGLWSVVIAPLREQRQLLPSVR